jgi:hypothetical protein
MFWAVVEVEIVAGSNADRGKSLPLGLDENTPHNVFFRHIVGLCGLPRALSRSGFWGKRKTPRARFFGGRMPYFSKICFDNQCVGAAKPRCGFRGRVHALGRRGGHRTIQKRVSAAIPAPARRAKSLGAALGGGHHARGFFARPGAHAALSRRSGQLVFCAGPAPPPSDRAFFGRRAARCFGGPAGRCAAHRGCGLPRRAVRGFWVFVYLASCESDSKSIKRVRVFTG